MELTIPHQQIIRTHTNFVQDVRFSHSGDHFASVGSDRKLFLYDGKTGDTVGEIEAHNGSIVSSDAVERMRYS